MKITREKIREYVAQDNVQCERVYFKHMAVESVEIFCRFPNSDVGKLRLIDLPGLGDTRKGDVEQLIKALSDQKAGASNIAQCELLQKSIITAQIHVLDTIITDGTNYDDVSANLIDRALNFLAGNIERNDAEYSGKIYDEIERAIHSSVKMSRSFKNSRKILLHKTIRSCSTSFSGNLGKISRRLYSHA